MGEENCTVNDLVKGVLSLNFGWVNEKEDD
jgi:hypothetical protein